MFQHFATIHLRQSYFGLADELCVVIRQTLNCLMDQRFSVASLLRGDTIQLGLQFWRKIYFHAASVSAPASSVKAAAFISPNAPGTAFAGIDACRPPSKYAGIVLVLGQ